MKTTAVGILFAGKHMVASVFFDRDMGEKSPSDTHSNVIVST